MGMGHISKPTHKIVVLPHRYKCCRYSYIDTHTKDVSSIGVEHGFYSNKYSLGVNITSQDWHGLTYTANSKIILSSHDLQQILAFSIFKEDKLITNEHIEYYKHTLYALISEYSVTKFVNNPKGAREFLLTKFAEMHNPFQYYLNKLREKNDC